jgi:hypothetical protein
MYVSPPDNKQVKEVKAVPWVPHRGSNNTVELPAQLPKDDFLLKDLEPLGWIKTQALELNHLSPTDMTTQAKLMADRAEFGSSSMTCTVASFTPGSVSLSAHSLTVAGFKGTVKTWTIRPIHRASTPTSPRAFNVCYRIASLVRPWCPRARSGTMSTRFSAGRGLQELCCKQHFAISKPYARRFRILFEKRSRHFCLPFPRDGMMIEFSRRAWPQLGSSTLSNDVSSCNSLLATAFANSVHFDTARSDAVAAHPPYDISAAKNMTTPLHITHSTTTTTIRHLRTRIPPSLLLPYARQRCDETPQHGDKGERRRTKRSDGDDDATCDERNVHDEVRSRLSPSLFSLLSHPPCTRPRPRHH